jgi:hypothetical protein
MGVLNHTVEKSADVEGEIACYGLESWWLTALSAAERERIEAVYHHPGLPAGERPLTTGSGPSAHQSVAHLLIAMAGPVGRRPEDRDLASRILAKAEECAKAARDVLALHLTYEAMIELHDRWRNEFPDAGDAAFAACYKQTRIAKDVAKAFRDRYPMRALPTHNGYVLMVSMLTEEGSYAQAISFCEKAKAQGWPGDWVQQIQHVAKAAGYPVTYISSTGITQI